MTGTTLRGFRLKMFRALQFFVPEGSSLDAVFNSYDDWRRFRAQFSKSSHTTAASAESSKHPSQAASQQVAQPDSNRN